MTPGRVALARSRGSTPIVVASVITIVAAAAVLIRTAPSAPNVAPASPSNGANVAKSTAPRSLATVVRALNAPDAGRSKHTLAIVSESPRRNNPPKATSPARAAGGENRDRWKFAAGEVRPYRSSLRRAPMREIDRVCALAAAVALMGATRASAQSETRDPVGAEALFNSGKALLAEGDWAAACDKFEKSSALDLAVSTVVKIARCREHDGKVASAWYQYERALNLNREIPAPSEHRRAELDDLMSKAVAALEPRIPKLRITVHAAPAGARCVGTTKTCRSRCSARRSPWIQVTITSSCRLRNTERSIALRISRRGTS